MVKGLDHLPKNDFRKGKDGPGSEEISDRREKSFLMVVSYNARYRYAAVKNNDILARCQEDENENFQNIGL